MPTPRSSLALAVALMLSVIAAPVHARRVINLSFPPFEVPPRSDLELCTFVPLPMNKGFDIVGTRIQNVGVKRDLVSHHFLMWTYDGKDMEKFPAKGQLVASKACLDFGPTDTNTRTLIAGSQRPLLVTKLPKGLAQEIKPTVVSNGASEVGIILNTHWINSGDQPRRASVRVKLFGAKRHTVRQRLLPMFAVYANAKLFVPPHEQVAISSGWPAGEISAGLGGGTLPDGPACVVLVTSHMHKRGKLFKIEHVVGGAAEEPPVLQTQDYSDPPQVTFPQPMVVNPGEALRYTCMHDNGMTTPVKLGCEEVKPGCEPGDGDWRHYSCKPGDSALVAFERDLTTNGAVSGAAKRCSAEGPDPSECPPTDPDFPGRTFTGNCVEANLVFGYTSDDDMCIMPGSYYPVNAQGSCDLSGLPILN